MAWSREETIGREEMRRIQLGSGGRWFPYVHAKNPVYRKKLDEAGGEAGEIRSLDDVRRLPFTTKVEIRDYYPFGLFTAAQEDIVEFHATSGTTGKMVVIGYTRNDVEAQWTEVMARACTGAGITKNDIVQNIYGYGLFTGGLGTHYGAIRVGAAVIPISGGNTQKQIMLMQDFGSTVVTSTPSFLMRLHEVGVEMGVDLKSSNRIGLLGAEPWSESMRQSIDERFGIKACDMYGLSEMIGPGVSFECHEMRNGLHVNEDYFYPEIIHPDTDEVLPYGEEGELVITNFANEGQPLMRYRTRDIAADRRPVRLRTDPRQDAAGDGPDRRHADHPRRELLPVPDRVDHHEAVGRVAALPDRRRPSGSDGRGRGEDRGERRVHEEGRVRRPRGERRGHPGRRGDREAEEGEPEARYQGYYRDHRGCDARRARDDPAQRGKSEARRRPTPEGRVTAEDTPLKLKRLSIFLENAPGRLYEATHALGEAGINLRSLCISDSSDFGVLRILVSDVGKARRVIMEKQLPARVDDVVAVEIDDTPGSLARILYPFKEKRVNVEYMYALAGASSGKAVMVFRFSDNDKAIEILRGNKVRILDAEAFGMLENK